MTEAMNERLQDYITYMNSMEKEKEALEQEVAVLHTRMEKDKDMMRLRFAKELESTRTALEHELDQITRLQVLEQEQHAELTKLRPQVKELHAALQRVTSMETQMTALQEVADAAEGKVNDLTTATAALKRELNAIQKEHRQLKTEHHDVVEEANLLRQENSEFVMGRDEKLVEIREAHAEEMRKMQLQGAKEADERVKLAEAEVRNASNAIIEGQKTELSEFNQANELMKHELERTNTNYEESLKSKQEMSEKANRLEIQLQNERRQHKEEMKSMEESLAHLRQYRIKKDQEFNVLMDKKIAMDTQMNAFRMIIDREVKRVGTSKSKRKASSGGSSSKKAKAIPQKSPVQLNSLNLESNFVIVENMSNEPISMEKWKVQNMQEKTYTFPSNYVLAPKSQVKVGYSKSKRKAKTTGASGMDFLGSKRYLWNSAGDIATLLNPDGAVVAQLSQGDAPPVEIEEAAEDILNDLYHEEPALQGNEEDKSCCIM